MEFNEVVYRINELLYLLNHSDHNFMDNYDKLRCLGETIHRKYYIDSKDGIVKLNENK